LLNTGCVPSKTLIRWRDALPQGRARYGLRDVAGSVDFAAVMQRVRDAIATIAPNLSRLSGIRRWVTASA
jgi:pyruvate/2-oxoglutarate dehydrogenase complex dihydrolipoamide dehydrogenase (E3) component